MAEQTTEQLTAKIDANVQGYIKGLEAAGTEAAMFSRAQLDMAANIRKMAEAANKAGDDVKNSGNKFTELLSKFKLGSLAKDALKDLKEVGDAAIDAANQMDPKGAAEWQHSVSELRNAALSLAGDVGKTLRPVLESVMHTLTGWVHAIRGFDFKSFFTDITASWGVMQTGLGNQIDGFIHMLTTPFQALLGFVTTTISQMLDGVANLADAAKKAGFGPGGQAVRELSLKVYQAGQTDLADKALSAAKFIATSVTGAGDGLLSKAQAVLGKYEHAAPPDFKFATEGTGKGAEAMAKAAEASNAAAKAEAAIRKAAAEYQLALSQREIQLWTENQVNRAAKAQAEYAAQKTALEEALKSGSQAALASALGNAQRAAQALAAINAETDRKLQERAEAMVKGATAEQKAANDALAKAQEEVRLRTEAENRAAQQVKAAPNKAAEQALKAAETAQKNALAQQEIQLKAVETANKKRLEGEAAVNEATKKRNADELAAQQRILDLKKAQAEADQRFKSYLSGQAQQMMGGTGATGSLINAGIQGGTMGGPMGAVAGVAMGLVQQSSTFKAIFDKLNNVIQGVADTLGAIYTPFLEMAKSLEFLVPLVKALGPVIAALGMALGTVFVTINVGFLAPLLIAFAPLAAALQPLSDAASKMMDSLGKIGTPAAHLQKVADRLFQQFDYLAVGLQRFFTEFDPINETLLALVNAFRNVFGGSINKLANEFAQIGAILNQAFLPYLKLFQANLEGAMRLFGGPLNYALEGLFYAVRDGAIFALQVGVVLGDAWDNGLTFLQQAIQQAAEGALSVAGALENVWNVVLQAFAGMVSNIRDATGGNNSPFADVLKNLFQSLIGDPNNPNSHGLLVSTDPLQQAMQQAQQSLSSMDVNTQPMKDAMTALEQMNWSTADSAQHLKSKFDEMAASMTNIPSGFKVAAEHLAAMNAQASSSLSTSGGLSFSDQAGSAGAFVGGLPSHRMHRSGGGGGGAMYVGVINVLANDPGEFYRQMKPYIEQDNARSGGSRLLGKGSRVLTHGQG